MIVVNNPWIEQGDIADLILCEDKCDQVPWVNWDTQDIVKGYTYCCDVASFHAAVPYAPDLGSLPLLNYGSK